MTSKRSVAQKPWKSVISIRQYTFSLAAAWTLLFISLCLWNAHREMQDQRNLVRNQARAHFLKDQAFRYWATEHGGVYVPVTEHTPPNPYLSHIPDRDIETQSGKKLTLMNPAYMVRQLMEDFGEMYGIRGRITSLKPLRPRNAPDLWERASLESFEKGAVEVDEFTEINGKPYLRMMRPMKTEKLCLKCHAHQGYKEGDIRGGVGISVPAEQFFGHGRNEILRHTVGMIFVWLIGLVGLFYGSNRIRERLIEQKRAQEEKQVMERRMLKTQKLESLGILAGGIAHDFNNLLAVVLGNAELALYKLDDMSPVRRNIEAVRKASNQAAELTNQILAYSGKGRFVVEPINIEQLLEEMSDLLKALISRKTLLEYKLTGNLPTFSGDLSQIRQVLVGLITNAAEAIGENHGSITLNTGRMDCNRDYLDNVNKDLLARLDKPLAEGEYVYFEVSDTGCGMDVETMEKIFDPFFTTKFIGRGLGMSAILGIVDGHRGAIVIQSKLGDGTTFKVLFPADEHADEKKVEIQKEPSIEENKGQLVGTILIADDEKAVLGVGKAVLENMGFNVLTASDGGEAVEVFHKHKDEIRCVLLDLTMPRMDGEEAFREIRRIKPDVKVILLSGYNEQEATQHFIGKGLTGFMQKPYTMRTLEVKLMSVLQE